jgi:hypothetical protein
VYVHFVQIPEILRNYSIVLVVIEPYERYGQRLPRSILLDAGSPDFSGHAAVFCGTNSPEGILGEPMRFECNVHF